MQERKLRALDLFSDFDRDGDGTIDAGELRAAFASQGTELAADFAEQVLSELDQDGDREVRIVEFIEQMRAVKNRRAGRAAGVGVGGGSREWGKKERHMSQVVYGSSAQKVDVESETWYRVEAEEPEPGREAGLVAAAGDPQRLPAALAGLQDDLQSLVRHPLSSTLAPDFGGV